MSICPCTIVKEVGFPCMHFVLLVFCLCQGRAAEVSFSYTHTPMSIKPMRAGVVRWRLGNSTGQDWCLMARLIINPLSNYEMVKSNEISATRFLMSVLPIPHTLCLRATNDNICICHAPWSLHNTWIWTFLFCTRCSCRCSRRQDNESVPVCVSVRDCNWFL